MSKNQSIDAVAKIVREQGYRYCCLLSSTYQTIVPFNRPGKEKIEAKITEIKKRMQALPDGLYYVMCKNSFTPSVQGDNYPVIKGNVQVSEGTPQAQPGITVQAPAPVIMGDPSKVMSYTEALLLTQENATLKAEVQFLKAENVRLNAELAAKTTALSEAGDKPMWQEWADNTLPSILPIIDRYFDLEERKLQVKEKELGRNGNGSAKPQANRPLQVPKPGTPEFEEFLNWMEGLQEQQFNNVMMYLYKTHPDVYEICYDEFYEEEENQPAQNGQSQNQQTPQQ